MALIIAKHCLVLPLLLLQCDACGVGETTGYDLHRSFQRTRTPTGLVAFLMNRYLKRALFEILE